MDFIKSEERLGEKIVRRFHYKHVEFLTKVREGARAEFFSRLRFIWDDADVDFESPINQSCAIDFDSVSLTETIRSGKNIQDILVHKLRSREYLNVTLKDDMSVLISYPVEANEKRADSEEARPERMKRDSTSSTLHSPSEGLRQPHALWISRRVLGHAFKCSQGRVLLGYPHSSKK